MSILDAIGKRRDRIMNRFPTEDVPRWESFGHRDEFSPPEYGDYIATNNDIYSAANLRARSVSGVPVKAFRGRDVEKQEVTDGLVVDLLHKVNPFWTFQRLMRMTDLCMSLWGEGFWAVNRGLNGRGQPREIWWLKSDRVSVVTHPTDYVSQFLYQPANGGPRVEFLPSEVVWFRYPNPLDEWAGLAPMNAARLSADTSHSMMTSNRNLFRNGMQMGGLIAPKSATYTEEQAKALEGKLEDRLQGVDKAHRWAVLRFEASVNQMSVSPKDAEFIAGLNITLRRVCNAFGVPSPLLNDLEHATLANLKELLRALWELTLVPDLKFYAADLEEQFLPMFRVGRGVSLLPDHIEFDVSGVPALQEANSATWDRERQQIEAGGLLINEWRKSKGLPPVEWGDTWWAPVNKQPVGETSEVEVDVAAALMDFEQRIGELVG